MLLVLLLLFKLQLILLQLLLALLLVVLLNLLQIAGSYHKERCQGDSTGAHALEHNYVSSPVVSQVMQMPRRTYRITANTLTGMKDFEHYQVAME